MAFENMLSQFVNLHSEEVVQPTTTKGSGGRLSDAISSQLCPILYESTDEEKEVTLKLELKRIGIHPEELIEINIQPFSVEVKVRDYKDGNMYFKLSRLTNKIDNKKSTYKIRADYILIRLLKVKRAKWNHIQYHHPEILKNFKRELSKFFKTIPCPQIEIEDRCDIRYLESLPCFDIDYRDFLINDGLELPSDVITIEQILEFLKSYIKPYSKLDTFIFLGIAFYLNERKKYEQIHPEILKEYDRHKNVIKPSANKKAEEWKIVGNNYFKAQKFSGAVAAYSEAIKLDPRCPTFYVNRTIAYFHMNSDEDCLNNGAVAVSLDPFYAKVYVYMAKCLLMECYTKDSNILLDKAKLLDPTNKLINERIDESYLLRHDIDMYVEAVQSGNEHARETHLKSMTKVIQSSCAAEKMVKLLCDKGMISEAKSEACKLSQIHPCNNHIKYNFLAMCYFYEDNEEKYRENYQLAKMGSLKHGHYEKCEPLESMGEIFAVRSRGDKFYQSKRYKDAITCYLNGIGHLDTTFLILAKFCYKIACANSELNNIPEAILYFGKAIKMKEDYHEAFAARGEHYLKEKKFKEAFRDFKKAYEIFSCDRYQELINKGKSKQSGNIESVVNTTVSGKCSSLNNRSAVMQKALAVTKSVKGDKQFESKRYKEAIDSYSESIELDPDNSGYYCNRSACYIMLKDFEKGYDDADRALSLDPRFVKGIIRMGQCYIAFGRPENALDTLEEINELNPSDKGFKTELKRAKILKEDIEKGDNAFDAKDYASADGCYSSALTKAEACVQLFLKRVKCLIYLEKFDEAIAEAELACSIHSESFKVYFAMGVCYFNKMDIQKAIIYLEKSVYTACYDERMGGTLKLIKEYEKSIKNASKQSRIKLFSETKSVLLSGCDLLGEEESDEEEELSECQDKDDKLPVQVLGKDASTNAMPISQCSEDIDCVQRATCYMEMKNYQSAMAYANEAIKKDSKCLQGHKLIGQYNTIFGNVEEAISAFETAKKIDSSDKKVNKAADKALKLKKCLNDAEEAVMIQKFVTAFDLYRCASKIAHRNSSLLLNVAECAISLHNLSALFKLADSVPGELKKCAEYYCILGLKKFYSYNSENESIELIEKALEMDPVNEKYRKYLSVIQSTYDKMTKGFDAYQHNKLDQALVYFNEGLDIESNNPVINSEFDYYIGLIMMKQIKIDEAVEWFSKAVSIKEKFIHVLDNTNLQKYIDTLEKRALCYKKLDMMEDAITDYISLFKLTSERSYEEIANDLKNIEEERMLDKWCLD